MATCARIVFVEATPNEMRRALAAVAAMLGGPHCSMDGRSAAEWVAVAVAELLAEAPPMPDGLPLWVMVRDRVAAHVLAKRDEASASMLDEWTTLQRRVSARLVARRLDDTAERVLLALYDGIGRTDQIAAHLSLTCAEVIRARKTIAAVARDVASEQHARLCP